MFGRKKQEEWWQPNELVNAQLNETQTRQPAGPAPAQGDPAPAEEAPEKPRKKHRWHWMDVAGDVLEAVFDILAEIFD